MRVVPLRVVPLRCDFVPFGIHFDYPNAQWFFYENTRTQFERTQAFSRLKRVMAFMVRFESK